MQNTYTTVQLADITGIPVSTVRYYAKQYSDYMPRTSVVGSKYPIYEKQAIQVLKDIRKSQNNDHTKPQILQMLSDKYERVIDGNQQDDKQPATSTQQPKNNIQKSQEPNTAQTLANQNFIQSQLEMVHIYAQQNAQQRELIRILSEQNTRLAEQVRRLSENIGIDTN